MHVYHCCLSASATIQRAEATHAPPKERCVLAHVMHISHVQHCVQIGTVIDRDGLSNAIDTFTNTREYRCDNTGSCTMPIGEVSKCFLP